MSYSADRMITTEMLRTANKSKFNTRHVSMCSDSLKFMTKVWYTKTPKHRKG